MAHSQRDMREIAREAHRYHISTVELAVAHHMKPERVARIRLEAAAWRRRCSPSRPKAAES